MQVSNKVLFILIIYIYVQSITIYIYIHTITSTLFWFSRGLPFIKNDWMRNDIKYAQEHIKICAYPFNIQNTFVCFHHELLLIWFNILCKRTHLFSKCW